MKSAPDTETTQIVFIGRKNTGKSSLVNAFFGEEISVVDDAPGTTTHPFYNIMELLPYGPVVLVDTAGIDDSENLNKKQISRTIKSISSADLAVFILDARTPLSNEEVEMFFYLDKIAIPYIVAVNKIEFGVNSTLLTELINLKIVHYEISCKERVGIEELKLRIMRKLPREGTPTIFNNLISKDSMVLFVIPEDLSSPHSKCALFQMNLIKELVSENVICTMVKDKELESALASFNKLPDLVVTDSSVLRQTISRLPENVKLTTFSMLLGRQKGNIETYIKGIKRLGELRDGDRILIAEACNYHNPRNDSGNNTFSEWIRNFTNKNIRFDSITGSDLPENLGDYSLIVHCNGCMITRKEMQTRLKEASILDVPMVSYGLLAAYMNDAVPRVLVPFS